jgi:uncharacterized SAM-binding protein YcdF (DUF218 family)
MIGLYILCLTLMCLIMVFLFIRMHFKKAGYNQGLKRDVMIVLGYPAKNDGSMSPILRERINKAADLYHAGIAEVVICSGAAVANHHVEANVMARSLVELGVNCSQIIRETKARGTYENLVKSREIMYERGLEKAVIVTSPWHLRKASSYAFRLEIEHTLEDSKVPKEFIIGVGFIFVFINDYNIAIGVILQRWGMSSKKKKQENHGCTVQSTGSFMLPGSLLNYMVMLKIRKLDFRFSLFRLSEQVNEKICPRY